MVRSLRTAVCAGFVLLSACGSGTPTPQDDGTITREQFINVLVALRNARREAEDADDFAARKTEILERHGVTAAALIDFAQTHGGDLPAMTTLWDTIGARLIPPDSTGAAS